MQTVTSRIKTIFTEEQLRYIAAICDTKRLSSNNKKMVILCNLLYTYGIDFEILGGATNRIALLIGGYALKFAMDEQGYIDNLVEYSICDELLGYNAVSKSYETNGYILVHQYGELMTTEQFKYFRSEMRKILYNLSQDYLLGDVGLIDKNRTNWAIIEGRPVIIDYAYIHRATENLFTCDVCGSPLTPDENFDIYLCVDRSGCKAKYTYSERKRVQGNQVDLDMIEERKKESIVLGPGVKSKDMETFEDRVLNDKYIVIDNYEDEHLFHTHKKEIKGGDTMITVEERFNAMMALAKNPDDEEAKKILYTEKVFEDDELTPIYTESFQEKVFEDQRMGAKIKLPEAYIDDIYEDDEEEDETRELIKPLDLSDIMNQMKDDKEPVEHDTEETIEESSYSSLLHEVDEINDEEQITSVGEHVDDEFGTLKRKDLIRFCFGECVKEIFNIDLNKMVDEVFNKVSDDITSEELSDYISQMFEDSVEKEYNIPDIEGDVKEVSEVIKDIDESSLYPRKMIQVDLFGVYSNTEENNDQLSDLDKYKVECEVKECDDSSDIYVNGKPLKVGEEITL